MRNDFAVFIITHGRAEKQLSYESIRRCGYTGKIYLVIDDMDEQAEKYKTLYGDEVIIFEKEKYWLCTDTANNQKVMSVCVYARNACFDIAEKLGLRFFCVLDDDITGFGFKMLVGGKLTSMKARKLDTVLQDLIGIIEKTDVKSLGMCAEGWFAGGAQNEIVRAGLKDAICSVFIHATCKRIEYVGTTFEDIVTHMLERQKGAAMFSVSNIYYTSKPVGSNEGGVKRHTPYQMII